MFGGAPAQLKVVRAGRVIVLPLVHKVGRLHLSARQINVNLADAVTKQGIKVAVQGVATVKIGGDEESIRNAAERFLDRDDQIEPIVKNVLEGSLRSIVGTLTVEELNYDRQKFQQEVQSAAKSRPRDVRPDDRQLHDPGDPRRGRLHGPHRPAGDRPPRARRAHGEGPGRPGGRGPRGRGAADQAQRPARRVAPHGGGRGADRGRRGEGRPGRAARPGRGAAGGRPPPDRARPARGGPHAEGAHRDARSARPRPRRRPRSGAPRATSSRGSRRRRPMRSGSSSPARPRRRSR